MGQKIHPRDRHICPHTPTDIRIAHDFRQDIMHRRIRAQSILEPGAGEEEFAIAGSIHVAHQAAENGGRAQVDSGHRVAGP